MRSVGVRLRRRYNGSAIRWLSSDALRPPRGTVDLTGDQCAEFQYVESQGRHLCQVFGLEEIRTPIFEHATTFSCALGEGSEVVNKEMYRFDDKSGNEMTLRPENTAAVMRAVLSNKLLPGSGKNQVKYYYHGPMFRYERPQKGRQRQFTQFGVELMGVPGPSADIEAMELGHMFLQRIGLLGSTKLLINTLGDQESRRRYCDTLLQYFTQHKDRLSKPSQENVGVDRVLRILDSKHDQDQPVIAGAPHLADVLSKEAKDRFSTVLGGLDLLNIPYELDPLLVRGLDYYSHTIFEFVLNQDANQAITSQQRPLAILAGGRYDNLADRFQPKASIPAVGWAAGVERLCIERERLQLTCVDPHKPKLFVAPIIDSTDDDQKQIKVKALQILHQFRQHDISSELWNDSIDSEGPINQVMKKVFKEASKRKCNHVVFIGSHELASGNTTVTIKNLQTGQQETLHNIEQVLTFLQQTA